MSDEAATDRTVITLNPAVGASVRRMGLAMSGSTGKPPGPAEVVKRALILLNLRLSLGPQEELVILNRSTGDVERIRFEWEMLSNHV